MNLAQSDLARLLWEIGAIKGKERSPDGNGYRLKLHEKQPDAPLSPIFLNLRTPDNPKQGPLTERVVQMIGNLLSRLAHERGLEFDHAAGVPHAGDPFAEAFAELASPPIPLIKLHKEEGPGGRRVTAIKEASYGPGQCVLLIDDLVTGADSKLEAIQVLELEQLVVRDVLVLVDREQGGVRELQGRGYNVHTVFTLRGLLHFYYQSGHFSLKSYGEIVNYLNDNS